LDTLVSYFIFIPCSPNIIIISIASLSRDIALFYLLRNNILPQSDKLAPHLLQISFPLILNLTWSIFLQEKMTTFAAQSTLNYLKSDFLNIYFTLHKTYSGQITTNVPAERSLSKPPAGWNKLVNYSIYPWGIFFASQTYFSSITAQQGNQAAELMPMDCPIFCSIHYFLVERRIYHTRY